MINVCDVTWELFETKANEVCQNNENIFLDKGKFYLYKEEFYTEYNHIKSQYMKDEVQFLDRHKVAAIIITSLIKTKPIDYIEEKQGDIFIGLYYISISVGLSYMLSSLNEELEIMGLNKIVCFEFPPQMCCDQDYLSVLCRNLYILNSENRLYSIDLANILFLIESYTLLKNGIDNKELR